MQDGSTFYGTEPHSMRPALYFIFICISNYHFTSFLREQRVLPDYDAAQYGPIKVQMNIRNGQFFTAHSFQVYKVNQHNHRSAFGNFLRDAPPNYHIYLYIPHDIILFSLPLQYYS